MEEKPQNEKTHQLKYFIDNKIVDSNSSKSISEHYLSIPFKIFSLLFKSFTEDSVKITNNLSLYLFYIHFEWKFFCYNIKRKEK